MTSPTDPTRPVAPTVREISALTARLRDMSARGRDVHPDERAAFLADKDALVARIIDAPADEGVGGGWSAQARSFDPDAAVVRFEQSGYYSDADIAASSDAIAAGDLDRASGSRAGPGTPERLGR
jgi:hypothetical protein